MLRGMQKKHCESEDQPREAPYRFRLKDVELGFGV